MVAHHSRHVRALYGTEPSRIMSRVDLDVIKALPDVERGRPDVPCIPRPLLPDDPAATASVRHMVTSFWLPDRECLSLYRFKNSPSLN